MKTTRELRAVAAVLLLAAACGDRAQQEDDRAGPPNSDTTKAQAQDTTAFVRRAIIEWLECEECREGQLESVVRLREQAVPTLTATLLEGPSPVRLDEQREHLNTLYQQQVVYARTHPQARPTMSNGAYVELYMGNLISRYQTRSATALERIGGPAARDALGHALQLNLREDVRAAVTTASQRIR